MNSRRLTAKRRHSSSCLGDSGITLSAHTKHCVTRACVKMFPVRGTVEARSTRGSIPARGSSCERRLLLGRDPLGLLREPEPFAHKLVKAGP